jgi:methionine synthase II (cobalamin-independent)
MVRNLWSDPISSPERPGPATALDDRLLKWALVLDDVTADTFVADVVEHIVTEIVEFAAAAREVQIADEAVI